MVKEDQGPRVRSQQDLTFGMETVKEDQGPRARFQQDLTFGMETANLEILATRTIPLALTSTSTTGTILIKPAGLMV